MKAAPEQYRLTNHPTLGSTPEWGNNGFFIIPHYKIAFYFIHCMISDGKGWEHVSVTIQSSVRTVERCPTWEEMCFVKDLFFNKNEVAIQYHPAEEDYVSTHPYCLHLWRPLEHPLPVPLPEMVGKKGDNIQNYKQWQKQISSTK